MFLSERISLAGSPLPADPTGRVRVLSGGRQLRIAIAEKSDAASYMCLASNIAGNTKKEYNLQVYGRPLCNILYVIIDLEKQLHYETLISKTVFRL